MVGDVVFPALEAEDDAADADRDDRHGDTAIGAVDPGKQLQVWPGQAGADQNPLGGKNAGQRKHQQVMQDGKQEIDDIHGFPWSCRFRTRSVVAAARRRIKITRDLSAIGRNSQSVAATRLSRSTLENATRRTGSSRAAAICYEASQQRG